MAVLPQFQDPGPPAYANAFAGGFGQGLSIVERKQKMRLNEQQAELEQAKFVAHLPLLQAQAENERISAAAALENAKNQEQLMAQAASVSVPYQNEYNDILKIPDWREKATALAAFQAKTAWLGDLKNAGYSGFAKAVVDARVQAETMVVTNEKLEARRDQDLLRNQYQAQALADRQAFSAQQAELRAQHSKELAEVRKNNTIETEDTKILTKSANEFNQKLLEEARDAVPAIRDADRAIELLDSGVRTGTGANIETSLRRAAVALGVPVKEAQVAKREELDRIFGDAVLKRVNQTKGAVSDKEMALFDNYSASASKTPDGNRAIITAFKRVNERKVKIAQMVNSLRRKGEREIAIQNAVNDFILDDANIFEGTALAGEAKAAGPAESVPIGLTPEQQRRKAELEAKLRQ